MADYNAVMVTTGLPDTETNIENYYEDATYYTKLVGQIYPRNSK